MAVTMMLLCLILVVPSALIGWATGATERAAASFSIGTNSNRLAFLCLMQAAFWWYFGQTQSRAGAARRLASCSRSCSPLLTACAAGFLGLGVSSFADA
jgi:hypothetical protein